MATKICNYCGKTFETSKRGQHKYCSDECRKKFYNPKRYFAEIEPKEPKESHINEINAEARARGMTYGMYQAQKFLNQMR